MTSRLASATGIWRARQPRAAGDRAYIAYSLVLLGLVVVMPVVRAAWLAVTTPEAADALNGPDAAVVAAVAVLALWAAALITGRSRGPAVAPPFFTYALTESDLPRREVFRSRVVMAVVVATVASGGIAVFFGAALGAVGLLTPPSVIGFSIRGVLIGTISAVCWLSGEAAPKASAIVAGALIATATLGIVGLDSGPVVAQLSSWAWASAHADVPAIAALAALSAGGLLAAPTLLDRISEPTLAMQSARWDVAMAHAVSLDFTAASESYQARPSSGRRFRAVIQGASPVTLVVVRDTIGALRTPLRVVSGALTIVGSGVLLVAAAAAPGAAPLLGALAAALLYVGTGAFSRGLQHISQVSRAQPLYGISDGVLILLHTIFPVVIAVVIAVATTISISAVLVPGAVGSLLWGSVALPVVVVAARVSNALRGPSPIFLMMPAPSALGDPMPLLRVLWALDAPLFAVLAGVSATAGPRGVGGLSAVFVVIGLFLLVRWLRRA
ncbi:hypothetical protein [Rathayibacter iranicus]|uniref:Uncharacterized protein n=2 Tax=Rathayibacter iranicus TaxID=59737 RepID=A0AAD1AG23_9MICO|nr:hypothetical protein [Rathayibacter iranicus]AZZ55899.1 hypothetical protein C7V51_08460 [Rathayibacter iranicus]MWV30655.1 hypothetical protein [Rathayibacter iranicus NCPPB 2253 = VKM Ac-1602]PPI47223.1 hypothetical protein C5E09_07495 [Rathayibacter iranicus]PPI60266.1 hypothetical protein C5E08_08425 [Rathayibacter iranicus]PPI71730.1 hypothetical protein C5E01_07460 [Rathayibacter iranicus]